MPDTNQTARIKSMHQRSEYKVFVGGRRDLTLTMQDQIGQPLTSTGASTATTATLAGSPTGTASATIPVVSTAGFIVPGTTPSYALIGTATTGIWLLSYTGVTSNSLTGVTWLDKTVSGTLGGGSGAGASIATLPSGTPVVQWFDIRPYVLTLQGPEYSWTNQANSIVTTMTIEGHTFDSGAIAVNSSVVVQARYYPDGSGWGPWKDIFRGYVSTHVEIQGYASDNQGRATQATWRVVCQGTSYLLANFPAPPQPFTAPNLVFGKTPTTIANSTLTDPLVLVQQGEGFNPTSADPKNATDGQIQTLWSTQASPSPNPDQIVSGQGYKITAMDLWIPPGALDTVQHLQWIDIYNSNTSNAVDDKPLRQLMLVRGDSVKQWHNDVADGGDTMFRFDWPYQDQIFKGHTHLIVCYDEAIFRKYWNVPQGTTVVSLKYLRPTWTFSQTAGYIGFGVWLDGISALGDVINYSTDGSMTYGMTGNPHYWYDTQTQAVWSGGAVVVPTLAQYGQGLKRYRVGGGNGGNDTNTAADWLLTSALDPGATPNDNGGMQMMRVDLGQFPAATLNQTITSSTLGWVNVSGDTSNYLPSGTMQFASGAAGFAPFENVSYDTITTTQIHLTARGVAGSTAQSWSAITTNLYQVYNSVAGNYFWVSSARLKRWKQNGNPSYPEMYRIRTSLTGSTDPLTYLGDELPSDWQTAVYSHGPTARVDGFNVVVQENFAPRPAQHIALLMSKMSDNGPARLNEFEVYQATDLSRGLPTLTTTVTAARKILMGTGLVDASEVAGGGVGAEVTNLKVVQDNALNQITSVLVHSGSVFLNDALNMCRFEDNPLWPTAAYAPVVFDWQDAWFQSVKVSPDPVHPCSQVQLTCTNPETQESYTVTYPDTPDEQGSVDKENAFLTGGMQQAMFLARYRYLVKNRGRRVVVQVLGAVDGIEPLQRHTLTAKRLDKSNVLMNATNLLVTSVRPKVTFTEHGAQVESEVALEEYPIG